MNPVETDRAVDLTTIHEHEYELPCTSHHCRNIGRSLHPADWAIYLSCTCVGYYCNWRMELYWAEHHVIGTICDIHDDYGVRLVNWIRIRRSA